MSEMTAALRLPVAGCVYSMADSIFGRRSARPRNRGGIMQIVARSFLISAGFLVGGCTPVLEIRTDHTSAVHGQVDIAGPEMACDTGHAQPNEYAHSIENYGKYSLGYVEFDDQGWSYNQNAQMQALESRLNEQLFDPHSKDTDFL